MKTKEELNAIKEEVKTLNKKLSELSEDELNRVAGGTTDDIIQCYKEDTQRYLEGILNPAYAYKNGIIKKEPSNILPDEK